VNRRDTIARFRVRPGKSVRLADHDPAWVPKELRGLDKDTLKDRLKRRVEKSLAELATLQEVLWASDCYALLVILQAMDAAGKDGIIEHVMTGMNPQGVDVHAFKQPSSEELDHDFLWRCARVVPAQGRIGIFNRSYYEEVLVVRVHPELLEKQRLPPGPRGRSFWKKRYKSINEFEHHLACSGTPSLKIFLHISKEEQRRRFLARLDDPEKRWKFEMGDVRERQHWDEYMKAYEQALEATSTEESPWYVVPGDHKWVGRAIVADILVQTLRDLKLQVPKISLAHSRELAEARRLLVKEKE
jgi:PPK2 family polyphosphate:nucleotide phosphotransferase